MAITALISFTNMSIKHVKLLNMENLRRVCNATDVDPGSTAPRDIDAAVGGNTRYNCCNMWVPHCANGSDFDRRHIELRHVSGLKDPEGNEIEPVLAYIWQEARADGDFVRCTTSGYEPDAPPIPGAARVTGNRDVGLTYNNFGVLLLWDPDPGVEIPDVPAYFRNKHNDWHMEDMEPTPNHNHGGFRHSGSEFLQFHRDYLAEFRAWYARERGYNQAVANGWTALPDAFNQPGDSAAQSRIDTVRKIESRPYLYGSADSLGDTIRSPLHLWLHHIPITTILRDVLITSFATSPRTVSFYQLHALIDLWWRRWETGNAAVFVSQTAVPTQVDPGQAFTVTVVLENTSRVDWPAAGQIQLGSIGPAENTNWGPRRIQLAQTTPKPRYDRTANKWNTSQAAITIKATAPMTPGTYTFCWRMVDLQATWFGDATAPVSVLVRTPPGQAQVPAVKGLSKAEAFIEIRAVGLKPAMTGGGDRVIDQRPPAGTVVPAGSTVTCVLRGAPPRELR